MNKFSITFTLLICLCAFQKLSAQLHSDTLNRQAEVQIAIQNLFDAMRNNDSLMLRNVFSENARLLSITHVQGETVISSTPLEEFIQAFGQPKDVVWNETIWSYSISIQDELASAWCPYSFFLEQNGYKQLLHCGVNSIELYRSASGWRITQITDTRTTAGCREN